MEDHFSMNPTDEKEQEAIEDAAPVQASNDLADQQSDVLDLVAETPTVATSNNVNTISEEVKRMKINFDSSITCCEARNFNRFLKGCKWYNIVLAKFYRHYHHSYVP